MQLYEKYRPKQWAEVVGQPAAVYEIEQYREQFHGLGGAAWWISGQSGTGKTTIGRLIAGEIASPWCTEELDGSRLTMEQLREWEHKSHLYGMGKGGWAFIVNEAHGLRKDTMRALLVALEPIPNHVCWIFTTTTDGQAELFEDEHDAPALLSRCQCIKLARRDLARPFAERCKAIAQSEGLDGQPIERYVKLMQDCHNNLREAIGRIGRKEMLAK